MRKSQILTELSNEKIVVVIRGEDKKQALETAKACITGGISIIEVAYTNPEASQVIKELISIYKEDSSILIGAGTILDPETARMAQLSGAKFVVSPSFNPNTATLCNRYAIPYIPGCMTLTEITTALEAGCDMVKVFPGGTVGKGFIKAIQGPLPQVQVMVTGGVNLANADDWLKAGATAIGIGGEFNKLAANGEFEEIRAKAREFQKILDKADK